MAKSLLVVSCGPKSLVTCCFKLMCLIQRACRALQGLTVRSRAYLTVSGLLRTSGLTARYQVVHGWAINNMRMAGEGAGRMMGRLVMEALLGNGGKLK